MFVWMQQSDLEYARGSLRGRLNEKQTQKAPLDAPATARTKVEINDGQSRTPLPNPSPRSASAASAPAMSSTATTSLVIVQQSPPLAVDYVPQ